MDKATAVMSVLCDEYACPLCGKFISTRLSDYQTIYELVACGRCAKTLDPAAEYAIWKRLL